jgi:septal ring factor EnvC (AmiA/AmiB activator)
VTRSARSDLLELAEELEREDRRLAAELEVVDGLAHRLHAVRDGVGRIEAQLVQTAREEEHLERALAEIDALLAGARAAAAEQDDSPDGHDGLPAALEERRRHTVERREQVAAERQDALDGVRALAGYVIDNEGRRFVVVAIVNHPSAVRAQGAIDYLVQWVYRHGGHWPPVR